jgi:phosphoglycolate phosphatase-like HAD superfamily hydrolase
MSLQAVIFDLDDTLLDTSALLGARDRRDFAEVYSRLHEVRIFEAIGGEHPVAKLPAMVSRLGMAVGLYTHSPEKYASELLRAFGMRVDEMVTGSDRLPPKPDPSGLLAVAHLLDIEPADCLYVGDSVGDFGAAAAAGMRSIGVSWTQRTRESWRHGWPDVAVDRPSHLMSVLAGAEGLGPLAEVKARGLEPAAHWGSLLRLGRATYGLGRYFPMGDRRYGNHALSHLILNSKDETRASKKLAGVFAALVRSTVTNPPQIVVSVPPGPHDERDRFDDARRVMAEAYEARDGSNLLVQAYGVENYKLMRRNERASSTVDRFKVTEALHGERVLLIDDVLTTGSQSSACRNALAAAGAGAITVLVASVTQDPLLDPCPDCGKSLGGTIRTKRRRRDGKEFQGCSRWPNCEWSRNMPPPAQNPSR